MGQGSSQNFWSPGDEGVRVSVISTSDHKVVGTPIDPVCLLYTSSPGCGKTTVSVKIAKHLAEKKKNVILVLSDMTLPMMPCICPMDELENIWSLGNVLAADVYKRQALYNATFTLSNSVMNQVVMNGDISPQYA